MNIVHLSDSHGCYREVTPREGDLVVHSGDALAEGTFEEYQEFFSWLEGYPCSRKIYVPGNHDGASQRQYSEVKALAAAHGIDVLVDEAVVIQGVKIYGSPWVPYREAWGWDPTGRAWTLAAGSPALRNRWAQIPEDVEILVTHGPAQDHGDAVPAGNYWYGLGILRPGCPLLRRRLESLPSLRWHLFGHIHGIPGVTEIAGTKFVNSAQVQTWLVDENPGQCR